MTDFTENSVLYESFLNQLSFQRPAVLDQLVFQSPAVLDQLAFQSPAVLNQLSFQRQSILNELLFLTKNVLNLPSISDKFRSPLFSDEFYSSYENLMRILDFPVVQPEITMEQLATKLERMDDEEFDSLKRNLSLTVDKITATPREKNNLKQKVSKVYNATKKLVAVLAAVDVILSMGERAIDFFKYVQLPENVVICDSCGVKKEIIKKNSCQHTSDKRISQAALFICNSTDAED